MTEDCLWCGEALHRHQPQGEELHGTCLDELHKARVIERAGGANYEVWRCKHYYGDETGDIVDFLQSDEVRLVCKLIEYNERMGNQRHSPTKGGAGARRLTTDGGEARISSVRMLERIKAMEPVSLYDVALSWSKSQVVSKHLRARVRAHFAKLERDGLIKCMGVRRDSPWITTDEGGE